MRIDFVITELFVGGAERCLTEIACGLAGRGDQVRVFSMGPLPQGQQSLLVDRLRGENIEVVSGDGRTWRDLLDVRKKLDRFFSESPPDLCQTFMFHANVLGALTAKRKNRDPVVVGGLRVAEDRWMRNKIEAMALSRMDGLICVSESVKDFAISKLGASAKDTFTIPNSVDVARFEDGDVFDVGSLGWPTHSQVILFVGRMHSQKGLDLIQSQIDQIVPKGGSRRLILVGDGPLSPSIDQWCNTVGKDRVLRMPWQSDVAPLVRRCDLLVLPSRYEGMPNVILEAMAAGRPVVCSRVEGVAELLGNDQIQTFDIGDDHAMAEQVNHLLRHRDRAIEIGASNQRRVRRDFSISSMVDAYQNRYRTLADRRLELR